MLSQEVQDAIKRKNQEMFARSERQLVMGRMVCPDCGGNLIDKSSFWRNMFCSKQFYLCTKCGNQHTYHFDDGA